MTKTKAIRIPGKERPAAAQSRIQRPLTTEPHHRNAGKNRKPSDSRPASQTVEGLDHRFLRSQPRVLGPGSLRKARPRRSNTTLTCISNPPTSDAALNHVLIGPDSSDGPTVTAYYLRQGSHRMGNRLAAGDRVRVSDDFFWAKGATGTVSAPPDAVTAISGPWDGALTRQEKSALGTNTVYWVWFDEPQFDADGDGPYRGGSIWEDALAIWKESSGS
jgi:hypothetical protein